MNKKALEKDLKPFKENIKEINKRIKKAEKQGVKVTHLKNRVECLQNKIDNMCETLLKIDKSVVEAEKRAEIIRKANNPENIGVKAEPGVSLSGKCISEME